MEHVFVVPTKWPDQNSARSLLEALNAQEHAPVLDAHWVSSCRDLRLLMIDDMLQYLSLPPQLIERIQNELLTLGAAVTPHNLHSMLKLRAPSVSSIEFKHNSDFDENGLLYFLGTCGRSSQWCNPMELGLCQVTMSSVHKASSPASSIVGRQAVRCVTSNQQHSSFMIELLPSSTCTNQRVAVTCRIQPTAYTLRHYSSWDNEALRHWTLEVGGRVRLQ